MTKDLKQGLRKYHESVDNKLRSLSYADYQNKVAMSQLQNYISIVHSRMAVAMYSWLNVWQYVSKLVRPYQMASRVPIIISLPKERVNESN